MGKGDKTLANGINWGGGKVRLIPGNLFNLLEEKLRNVVLAGLFVAFERDEEEGDRRRCDAGNS